LPLAAFAYPAGKGRELDAVASVIRHDNLESHSTLIRQSIAQQ
jgi:hypothetical protein